MRRFRRAGILVAITLLAWAPGKAQSSTRGLSGMVTDKRGNALPGAVVQLENTVDLSVRSFITKKDGLYHFNGLNDDIDYTLRAHYRTWWSERKTLSKFNSSKTPEVNLMIPIE